MTAENLSSLADSIPEPTPEPEPNGVPDNYVKVPLVAVINALRAKRTATVNKRKVVQKKKYVGRDRAIDELTETIHQVDATIALLEAGPKNQSFLIPLREAHAWGFGLMANGRWPKL